MATILDASLTFGPEAPYGTPVVTSRALEYVSEGLDFKPNRVQGSGLRSGTRVARANRRVTPTYEGGGPIEIEALSKGLGLFWQWLMGSGASTLVSTGVYQQVFTLADALGAATFQKGVPRLTADGSAAIDPITFAGCVATSFEVSGGKELLKVGFDVDAQSVTTAPAYAAPSYTTGANLFQFAGASLYTGALTAPTATALAAGATPLANVSEWSLKVDRQAKTDRYLFGNGGKKSKPVAGEPKLSGKLDVEYSDTIFRDTSPALTAEWNWLGVNTPSGEATDDAARSTVFKIRYAVLILENSSAYCGLVRSNKSRNSE
jgi:hypothetical protein